MITWSFTNFLLNINEGFIYICFCLITLNNFYCKNYPAIYDLNTEFLNKNPSLIGDEIDIWCPQSITTLVLLPHENEDNTAVFTINKAGTWSF